MTHKKIRWKWFNRIDAFFAGLVIIALFLWDISMNKIVDFKDIKYTPQIIPGTTLFDSISFMYLAGTALFVVLTILMVRATINKKGIVERDVIMGAIGLLGLVFLYGSAVLMIKSFGTTQIPFFFTSIQTLTLYHFGGIGLILVSDAYFLLTE